MMVKKSARAGNGVVRIIGGSLRSRRIRFEAIDGLRPSTDRVRETLFNWLTGDIGGARCLDLFAGSGALGFEAASRGAASVTMVEHNLRAVQHLKENCALLELHNIEILRQSAWSYLRQATDTFDIVFLDPPFAGDALTRSLAELASRPVLAADALVYVERRVLRNGVTELPGWVTLKHARAGDVDFRLLQHQGSPLQVLA